MSVFYTPFFKERLKECPREIRLKFYKQISYLKQNLRHPSLRAKKYVERQDFWQARVDRNYRFYFLIEKDTYVLIDIRPHPN